VNVGEERFSFKCRDMKTDNLSPLVKHCTICLLLTIHKALHPLTSNFLSRQGLLVQKKIHPGANSPLHT